MNVDGVGMISRNWTVAKFRELELELDSPEEHWLQAIEFMRERFDERYFNPIHQLMHDPIITGFTIMAINCLLIDAFYQFENGDEETRDNKARYIRFLRNYLSDVFTDNDMAKNFYEHIRCGILHSARTKKASQLTSGKTYTVMSIKHNTAVIVDVVNFSQRLERYFNEYIYRLESGNIKTREMFLKKMEFICER